MNTENYKTDEQVWYEICEGIIDEAGPEDIIPSPSNPYIYRCVDFTIRTSDSAMWMTISMFLRDGTHSVYLYVPNEYSYGTVSYFEKGATELFNKVYEKYFSVVR